MFQFAARYLGCAIVGVSGIAAVELPAVPGPPILGRERLGIEWGNDGFGPGGGAVSDDYRTNALSVVWDGDWWFIAADHSMLTANYPSGFMVTWGLPDPYAAAKAGQARRDELTIAAGLRHRVGGPELAGWFQGGLGAIAAGHLGGVEMQDRIHIVISSGDNLLPYEDAGVRVSGLAHAGCGGSAVLAGPLQAQVGAVSTLQAGGFMRWRAEADLVAAGVGGGAWLGCYLADWTGSAPSLVSEVVANHERGLAMTAGFGFEVGAVRWSMQIDRNLRNDAQAGAIGIAWVPDTAGSRADGEPWSGRFAVVAPDSLCSQFGYDLTMLRSWDVTCTPSLRVGYRDTPLKRPYTLDLVTRRQQLSCGPGIRPELLSIGSLHWFADAEAGIGVRHSQAMVNGHKALGDGNDSSTSYTVAIARVAAGLGMRYTMQRGPALGCEILFESTAAPRRNETVNILSPTTGALMESKKMVLEGSAWTAMAAIVADWRW